MINHGRTLLLNLSGPRNPAEPGDVYIPAYTQVVDGADALRQVLFGVAPDYAGRLYRCAQYMGVIHATKYAGYLTDLDPRITYSPVTGYPTRAGVEVVSTSLTDVYVVGTHIATPFRGRLVDTWQLVAESSTRVRVTQVVDGITQYADLAVSRLLSDPIALPGTDMTVRFRGAGLVPGDRWTVVARAAPTPGLPEVLAAATGAAGAVLTREAEEPFKTFSAMLYKERDTVTKLAGLLLALIYHTEAMRLRVD